MFSYMPGDIPNSRSFFFGKKRNHVLRPPPQMVSCHLNHDDVEYKLNETKTYKRDFSTVLHERGGRVLMTVHYFSVSGFLFNYWPSHFSLFCSPLPSLWDSHKQRIYIYIILPHAPGVKWVVTLAHIFGDFLSFFFSRNNFFFFLFDHFFFLFPQSNQKQSLLNIIPFSFFVHPPSLVRIEKRETTYFEEIDQFSYDGGGGVILLAFWIEESL